MESIKDRIKNHQDHCVICRNGLSDVVAKLRDEGLTASEIKDALETKHNLKTSETAVKRHLNFMATVYAANTIPDIDELISENGIDKLKDMQPMDKLQYIINISSENIAIITYAMRAFLQPDKLTKIGASSLTALSKFYESNVRLYIDSQRLQFDNEKMSSDELIKKLVELALEINGGSSDEQK